MPRPVARPASRAIGAPSASAARSRSMFAPRCESNSVTARMTKPTMTIAVPIPTARPVMSTTNHQMPIGIAALR